MTSRSFRSLVPGPEGGPHPFPEKVEALDRLVAEDEADVTGGDRSLVGGYGALNPMCQWVPLQKGLLGEPPQRHRVWRLRTS